MTCREILYRVAPGEGGRTVRDIMKHELGLVNHDISRAKYRKDGIRLNGERVYVTAVTADGDVLMIRLEDDTVSSTVPTPGPLAILYEDEDLLAVNKPAGLVVHPSHGHYRDTLGNYAAAYYAHKGERHDIRTIGRLDKDTSGILIYGKTRTAVHHLNRQTALGRHSKTYLALAEGHFQEKCGRFDGPIGRVPGARLLREVRADGDEAHTFYEVLAEADSFSLVRVRITTGRTHQIRVHMAAAGHPLLGDPLYGGDQTVMNRAALHCHEAVFDTVFSGRKTALRAALPPDMAACLPPSLAASLGEPTREYVYEPEDLSASE